MEVADGGVAVAVWRCGQDTEEYDFIEYTVVVKLTPDVPKESPSAMRLVGARDHFTYAREAGAAGCFRARGACRPA
jgi:hypothetical protein